MDLSIIIVNYNTKKLTMECIESVYNATTGINGFEIFLVDNASTDGSVEAIKKAFPNVCFIENDKNVGFSKANNQAIKVSKGRYILLLNSDTIVVENTLFDMIRFMDSFPDTGASGCKVILPTGNLDMACHRGFPTPSASFYYFLGLDKRYPNNPKYTGYHLNHLDMNEVHEVDCLVGAFIMVRRKVINEVGLLDETYFMYGEDIDWCYRIKEAGWKIYYNPHVKITHYKGASSRKKPFKIIFEFHRAMFIFHQSHFSKKYNLIVNYIIYTCIFIKFLSSVFLNYFKK
ncbi:MAG: glycosyltransferase family 2 protein [Bacillota bacterium]|nr:glycosyltransferase family 2 protein [Bacillota bacterium]